MSSNNVKRTIAIVIALAGLALSQLACVDEINNVSSLGGGKTELVSCPAGQHQVCQDTPIGKVCHCEE